MVGPELPHRVQEHDRLHLLANAIVVVGAATLSHFLVRDFPGKWFARFLILLPWAAPALSTIGFLWIFDSSSRS